MDTILFRDVAVALDELFTSRKVAADVINGPTLINFLRERNITFCPIPLTPAEQIERNMVEVNPMVPGEHSILEPVDGVGDMVDNAGPPVVMAPYKPPRDRRVQKLLKEGAKARAAEEEAKPREIFSDPRLDPNYRPPKPKA